MIRVNELTMTLKALRTRSGLTRNEVATVVGVDQSTITRWEKDSSNVPAQYMQEFASLYQYPIDNIFFGKNIVISHMVRDKRLKKVATT